MEMEEQKMTERSLMSQEEFEKYLTKVSELSIFEDSSKFKLNRAARRGHIIINGLTVPKRPFNNRANKSGRKGVHSRSTNEVKKQIYEQLEQYRGKTL